MPKKDAKYDKEVKTTRDLTTKRGRELYQMRRDTQELTDKARYGALEKNRIPVAGEGAKGRAKSDAAKKARGGKRPISLEAKKALINGQKAKPKKKKTFHYEYK